MSPNNLQLWYNLALARETFAVAVLQKEQKGEARTLAEVENAIEDLKVRLVTYLYMYVAPKCWPNARKSAAASVLTCHLPLCFFVRGCARGATKSPLSETLLLSELSEMVSRFFCLGMLEMV